MRNEVFKTGADGGAEQKIKAAECETPRQATHKRDEK